MKTKIISHALGLLGVGGELDEGNEEAPPADLDETLDLVSAEEGAPRFLLDDDLIHDSLLPTLRTQ